MTPSLTPDLTELERLYAEAESAPWICDETDTAPDARVCQSAPDAPLTCFFAVRKDARLIAAMHAALPHLITAARERDELKAERDEAQHEVASRREELKTARAAMLILYGDDHATQVYRDLRAERDEALRRVEEVERERDQWRRSFEITEDQRDDLQSALEDLQGEVGRLRETAKDAAEYCRARSSEIMDEFGPESPVARDGYEIALALEAALNPNLEAKS
jgi:chromosome segregation ATPase